MLTQAIHAIVSTDGKDQEINCSKTFRNEDYYTDFKIKRLPSGLFKLHLSLHLKRQLTLNGIYIEIPLEQGPVKALLSNGYQSWTGSKFYDADQQIPSLSKLARPLFKYYGDYHLQLEGIGKEYLHSWTYTKIQFEESAPDLMIASCNEDLAFTYFSYKKGSSTLRIGKDLKDHQASHSLPLFEIIIGQGSEEEFAKQWAEYSNTRDKRELPIKTAWNSWYKYQQDISVEKVRQLLVENEDKRHYDLIQLDDGYQKAIGDWLDWKPDFKDHMKSLVSEIKAAGSMPGIWLAPFVCETKSSIYKKHPDWILKDQTGKPVKAGFNGVWKSWYYPLDIANKEVQDYIRKVFFVLRNQYGFKVFKVDFLFAACISNSDHLTSAQKMKSGMELLRDCVGEDILLACGGPLASCFGLADICRIGPDTHLQWDFKWLKKINKRERPSNHLTLHSMINRHILGHHFFHNDPDVYILRDNNKAEGLQLSPNQKKSLLFVNKLMGAVHFSSDDPSEYSDEASSILEISKQLEAQEPKRIIRLSNDAYRLETKCGKIHFVNLSEKAKKISFKGHLKTLEAYQFLTF